MRVILSVPALLLVAACSSASGPSAVASSQANLASPPPIEAYPPETARPPRPELLEALVERPSSRDPFQAFDPTPPAPPIDTRPRKARRIPVEQLKLVALVTHTSVPRAMLVDPSGKGYIVTAGELVGRPEPLSGERVASFRVDRIREGSIVLVREDAPDRSAPEGTRVLSLPRTPLLQADD